MKLQSLTNVRPTKDLGTQVIASCTKGQFKLTPDAARKLGVVDGDYADIQEDIENPGSLYVVKGAKGNGGKLAGQGGSLTFSAAVAWNTSEADEDHNTHYNLGEAVEIGEGEEVRTFFPLDLANKVEKMKRGPVEKSADASEGIVRSTQGGNEEDTQSFEEM